MPRIPDVASKEPTVGSHRGHFLRQQSESALTRPTLRSHVRHTLRTATILSCSG
jgi:hypothetical protein